MGNKIKGRYNNIQIVDSDEIDDMAFLHILNNDPKFRKMIKEERGKPWLIHEKLTNKKRDEIIAKYKDKTIIFVGLTISLKGIPHIGYFIDISPEQIFRHIHLRTLDDIVDSAEELKKTFHKEDPEFYALLATYKYGIRGSFPYSGAY